MKEQYEIPEKPETIKEQTSMLWDAVFNHMPHRFDKMESNQRWTIRLIAGGFTVLAIVIALVSLPSS